MQSNDSRPSFLDQVLSDTVSEGTPTPEGTSPIPIAPLPPKKKRDPITPAQMMRVLGALILVGLIFFGTFLAYIVFNPGQAQFFIRFGINPGDVATLLQTLVNGIFGSLTFLLSITWIFLLFKAIITKKEYRRKKTLYIIGAFSLMLVLFSNIGFWAFLFQKIGASDFIKPNGGVTAYFNDLYLSDTYKNDAEIYDFNNLIGPLTVRYALASDVKYVSKSINISKFEIDCDGDGSPEHEGSDPALDNTLTCQFDRKGQFEPTGRYFGTDTVTREETTMPMAFIPVKIAGVVNIRQTDTNTVFDGSELEAIGNLVWREGKDFETIASEESKFTTKIEEGEKYICLVLRKWSSKSDTCERIFTVRPKKDEPITATLRIEPDSVNTMRYTMSVTNLKSKSGGDIESTKWFLDDTTPIGREQTVEKLFPTFGSFKISVEIIDTAGNKVTLSENIIIEKPLQLIKNGSSESLLVVKDSEGRSYLKDAYDRDLWAYNIKNLSVPAKLIFDASNIRVQSEGYDIENVEWLFNSDERSGLRVEYDFVEERRYEIQATYIFKRKGTGELIRVIEKIVIESKTDEVTANMQILPEGENDLDNLYTPARIRFDGSSSKAKTGGISKFIYDFGEGRAPSEGDAVQTYEYRIPGEYIVKLTAVTDGGERAIQSRKIIIKEIPKKVGITSSISEARVGKTVEFSSNGTVGQIDRYEWNFGDATELSREANPVHIFEKAGTFTVVLTITYSDGTIRTAEIEQKVGE